MEDLRELLATLDLGIAMARDPDGTIRHWSQGCERLYGWRSDEAIGQISHRLLATRFPIPLADIEKILRREGVWTGDLRHCTRDGQEVIASVRKVLRRDKTGRPIAVMESIADVTAQRAAEAQLSARNAQLAQAAKMEALGQLAAGMAHDFNNVLHTVRGCIELAIARNGAAQHGVAQALGIAQGATTRGITVTKRLLAFARQGRLQASAIEPGAMLHGLADMLRATIRAPITLHVDAPADLPPILADAGQLETVLVNLANNARDAMRAGGSIIFRAEATHAPGAADVPLCLAPGAYIRISVIDHGEGMKPEILARITEPFFTTKPRGKGTGLGLAMARGFAEQSGGALTIASLPGHGTTVSLFLPLAEIVRAPAPAEAGKAPATKPRGKTILVADDEDTIRDILGMLLTDHGYLVAKAENSAAALVLLDGGLKPDALMTDLAMPGELDGLDLIAALRRRFPRLPCLLVTGHAAQARPGPLTRAKKGGPFQLLEKPTSLHTLLAALNQVLGAA